MAKILICHVPKDGNSARELGGALMGRGHFVSFDGEPDSERPDRFSRLRHFEAVIVLWTETSYQSAGLEAIARETMPLNLLVAVRAEDLPVARLPLMFRKLNMFAPRDVDGIARLIARLSTAATSLKEMAEHATRQGAEPVWERAGPIKAWDRPKSLGVERMPSYASSPMQSALPEAIIPATHAQYTSRSPVHLDLPEVSEATNGDARKREGPQPEWFAAGTPLGPRSAPKFSNAASLAPQFGQKASEGRASPRQSKTAAPPMPLQLAERPAPYSAIANAKELSDAVEAGLLLHYIPEKMWLDEPGTVEVRLDREVLDRFFHDGERTTVESLSISLYGTGEAFEIERMSERTQRVGASPARSLTDGGANAELWRWHVIPLSAGTQDLVVRVSALLLDRNGVPAPVALPDRRFRVDIEVPERSRIMSSLSGWRRP